MNDVEPRRSTEAERELVIGTFNATTVDYPRNTVVREPHVRILAEQMRQSLDAHYMRTR